MEVYALKPFFCNIFFYEKEEEKKRRKKRINKRERKVYSFEFPHRSTKETQTLILRHSLPLQKLSKS